jgi:hypothetical protein
MESPQAELVEYEKVTAQRAHRARESGHPEARSAEGSRTRSAAIEFGIVTADLRSALPTAVGLPLVAGSLRSG